MTGSPILCLDFDGVVHSYKSGWVKTYFIPDPPNPGAIQFIWDAVVDFDVHIFSSRSSDPTGIQAMQAWLWHWTKIERDTSDADAIMATVKWPTVKPPALVTIGDRIIQFTGKWPDLKELKGFKPWYQRPPTPYPGPSRIPFEMSLVQAVELVASALRGRGRHNFAAALEGYLAPEPPHPEDLLTTARPHPLDMVQP
jgi:hypothetical protein